MPTEKLYWTDPQRTAFEATLVATTAFGGAPSLVLDATLFYPEAGGQLGDRGVLAIDGALVHVLDVQVDDDGVIHHLVADVGALAAGARVAGTIDADRRADQMAQHTGQHMLSRALLEVAGAETRSSRLGAETSTIDTPLAALSEADVARAEDLVVRAVLRDGAVRALWPTAEELARLPLRREPKVERDVRVIDIEGFDLSPCGGTHCTRTGQVGPVRVVGVERHKGGTRVTFLAGRRAFEDYRRKDAALGELARSFTCGPLDVAAGVARLRAESKARGDALVAARGELAALLVERRLAELAVDASGTTRVVLVRDGDDLAALRGLAAGLARRADVVAVVASREAEGGDWLLVVERGAQAAFDAGAWMRRLTVAHGGRGGGRPERAEGRLPGRVDVAEAARSTD